LYKKKYLNTVPIHKRILSTHNVRVNGQGDRHMLFANGYGCDQEVWQAVAPSFEASHKVTLFDIIGGGKSDRTAYDPEKYSTLQGYSADIIEICETLGATNTVLVAHSASCMTAVVAAAERPDLFSKLILIAPSPCYINHDGYEGGFTHEEIQALVALVEKNYFEWTNVMADVLMGNPDRPELVSKFKQILGRFDPEIARRLAKLLFMADTRGYLPQIKTPSLLLQCQNDPVAPLSVGHFLNQQIAGSKLVVMNATGHYPNMSAPGETVREIGTYLGVPHGYAA
jgi:sigma-B regulation protein RsbQ